MSIIIAYLYTLFFYIFKISLQNPLTQKLYRLKNEVIKSLVPILDERLPWA